MRIRTFLAISLALAGAATAENRVDPKPRQVSGEVLRIKQVEVRGTGARNLVVLLQTNRARRQLVVDLGAEENLRDYGVKVGDTIAVEGKVVRVSGEPFLVAHHLKMRERKFTMSREPQEAHGARFARLRSETGDSRVGEQPAE